MGPNMKLLQHENICSMLKDVLKGKALNKTMSSSTNQGKLYQEIVSIDNIFLILIPIFLLLI